MPNIYSQSPMSIIGHAVRSQSQCQHTQFHCHVTHTQRDLTQSRSNLTLISHAVMSQKTVLIYGRMLKLPVHRTLH